MPDILQELGHIALGSRLKRLAERLLADASLVLSDADLDIQPAHVICLAALDRYGPMSVGELVDVIGFSQPAVTRMVQSSVTLGLIDGLPDNNDGRIKRLSLSAQGKAALLQTQTRVWSHIGPAVSHICGGREGELLALLTTLETNMAEKSMYERTKATRPALSILPWAPERATLFHDINEEWVSAMFKMEETDRKVLENPQSMIIDRGGSILFVEADGLGIIGTCALMPMPDGAFELTKMGVLERARGLKAGEFLLAAIIEHAHAMQIQKLFLLTNKKCEAAIHLYEKLGFVHDEEIMATYGARYERCDVAMLYVG